MAYTLPDFNLIVNHYRMVFPYDFSTAASLGTFMANLRAYGREPRTYFNAPINSGGGYDNMNLLCPPLTDIRDHHCTGNPIDYVEVPAGSGRYYIVFSVDDVGKGFANEYRYATLMKRSVSPIVANWPEWPSPIP